MQTAEHAEITQRNAKESCAIGTFIRNLTILKIIEIAETVQQAAKNLCDLCATSAYLCGSGFNLSFQQVSVLTDGFLDMTVLSWFSRSAKRCEYFQRRIFMMRNNIFL
jgi:hypothetical protein